MEDKQKLKDFIISELLNGHKPEQLSNDQDLLISGLVDSMGVVRLINFIEGNLNFAVPPEDVTLENFQTIETIASYLSLRNGK